MPNVLYAINNTGEALTMVQSTKTRENCRGQREGLRDPVCGMAITAESEHHAMHDGEAYHFCSARCLDMMGRMGMMEQRMNMMQMMMDQMLQQQEFMLEGRSDGDS